MIMHNPRPDTETALGGAAGATVLVVDDDALVARSLRRVLEVAGYLVTTAENGSAAVEKIMHNAYDVVLSDIQMPGMSGVELLSVVRSYDLDVPVLLMTGEPTLETAIEAVSLGALQYLPKPTPNEVLLSSVKRASRLHRLARMKRAALKLSGEHEDQAGDRAGLFACFERALDSMWMAFQPVVNPSERRIFGYEALMRTSEASLPHPGAVLSAAERLGRLGDLGRRVRSLSAAAFARAPDDAMLLVNLHTQDLLDEELYAAHSPLSKIASRVILEITERSTIDDVKDVTARMDVLRRLGFRIAIDDLGAGYAGLSSFVALEPNIVKLDMSLVRGVDRSAIRQRIVGSMTALCKEMGMSVVAEGVETTAEHECVQRLGCGLVQGYLFAKPGPPFPQVQM
jgi:EAL domain-containing protein (putative c-di-GMP-specific phosphodiesterase class I)/CheY-like chemotaxis protein